MNLYSILIDQKQRASVVSPQPSELFKVQQEELD